MALPEPENLRRQRLIAQGFPLVDVRDVSTHWRPIKSNHARLLDPTSAIFPQRWKPYHNNPLLLYNPPEFACPDDPLRGCIIAKKDSWMLATRYDGYKAFKRRKAELARKEGTTHNYVPRSHASHRARATDPATSTPIANDRPKQHGGVASLAGKHQSCLVDEDIARSWERQQAGTLHAIPSATRKRKAETLEPDSVASAWEQSSLLRTASYARPDPGPRDHTSRFRATAPGPMSWTSHAMTEIIGKLSAVVSSLFGPVSHKSNAVEQRTTDYHTGNVALKKRRLSQRGDDDPSWIDEDARSRLWDRHIKCLHQGLSQATMCIKDQHAGDLDRRSAQRFSYRGDKFAHLKLENLVTLVMPITHASAAIEHLYSRDMLEQAKHYNKTPQARVRYRLERNGEDVSIDHAIRLLENLPSELVPILESWHVDDRLLRTVCNDLYALLAKRPIPSLVVNASPETLSLWERMARVPADEDVVMSDAPNTTVSPALLAIPGSFPEEDTNRVADAQPNLHTAEFAASRSAQSEMPLASKDSLPTFHDVIPFDLIQAHFVDPQSADTYSEKGSSDAHHNRSMRSILKDKLRSTSSPNAARTSRHRSRDHNPDHSPYKARSSVGSAIVSPVSKRSTSRSPPSYITRLKSPNSMRMTATSSASLFTPTSPSRQNTGHYFVSAGGKEAEDVVDDDQTTQIAEGSNTNLVHREAYDDTLSGKEATHSTSIRLLSHRDIADGHRDTARYLRHHIDEQEGQVESDSADEKQEDREHDVLTRHGASINVHMQEGLRKYYRPSSPFSGSDLDKQLSGLQISDERQSALDEVALRRQVEEEEREFLAAVAAKAAAEAEKKRADAEKLLKTGGLRPPHKPMVAPLSDDWLRKVEASVTRQGASVARTFEGTELTPRDFARVVPPTEWLNDEIVNGTLLWLDRFINLAAGVSDARSANRKCLALSSFIWKRIQDAGPGSTGRALRRFGVSKANFGDLDTVLLPVCENSHWTLIVVRPKMRTIAHMDSLSVAGSASKLNLAQAWVKAVLEENFIEAEWRVVRHEAPRQTNGYDCGVHTITNGMCIALGLNAIDTYASDQMPLQRLRIAAMLLNGGFSKDFDLAGL
ncbi:hypothetical protein VD0004_g9460 [Verticillium dahliae]|uniref:Ubiquitin-like protease family profile domain-containing protein n=1 Tax=Verticillium dahliae TaxID=27337 RepID=A0A444RYS1_VERDA|nr:hypothetical protein VD0004_g9460 [Verticillium dahliae]PNH70826.1 hypothetical protein VD0001_g6705 [Verticillium dahliae]RXG46290.1 hypothetical protein VDGE_10023 [Verticillium dahliae]